MESEWKIWILGTIVLPLLVWFTKVIHMRWKLVDHLRTRVDSLEKDHSVEHEILEKLNTRIDQHIDKTEKGFDKMMERMDASHEVVRTDIRELTKAILKQ